MARPRRPAFPAPLALAVLALALVAPAHAARHGHEPDGRTIFDDGFVRVTARLRQGVQGDGSPVVEALLRIVTREDCWTTRSYLWGDAVADTARLYPALAGGIGWKAGYFFVRTSCPSGNHWKCVVEQVFGFQRDRLVPLGALGERDADPDSVGACYRGGVFYDVDADWETASTGHACAPFVELAMRDAGGRFLADMQATWLRNAAQYLVNDDRIRSIGDPVTPSDRFECAVALFHNAVIAAYCDRPVELAATMAMARERLEPGVLREIQQAVNTLTPGGQPRRSRADVVRCTAGR
jgi:hypothetical protein